MRDVETESSVKRRENDIDIAAFEWLERHERGLTAQEAREFEVWSGTDTRHEGAFLRAAAASHQFGRHAAHYRVAVAPQLLPARRHEPSVSRRQVLGMALSGVCATAVGGWYLLGRKEMLGQRYITAIGQVWSGQLKDGSSIVMNTGTELFVNITSRYREIYLSRGEVMLTALPGLVKPLLVYAGSCMVRALGAAFSIRQDEGTTVTAVDGGVEILAKDATGLGQVLTPRQQAKVTDGGVARLSELSAEEVSQELAWRKGLLVYPNTPLRVVLADFGRYVAHRYTCRDERVCERRLVGVFQINKPEAFISVVATTLDLQAVTTGDQTVFEARRAPTPSTY
jgi:transmembrane sensor